MSPSWFLGLITSIGSFFLPHCSLRRINGSNTRYYPYCGPEGRKEGAGPKRARGRVSPSLHRPTEATRAQGSSCPGGPEYLKNAVPSTKFSCTATFTATTHLSKQQAMALHWGRHYATCRSETYMCQKCPMARLENSCI